MTSALLNLEFNLQSADSLQMLIGLGIAFIPHTWTLSNAISFLCSCLVCQYTRLPPRAEALTHARVLAALTFYGLGPGLVRSRMGRRATSSGHQEVARLQRAQPLPSVDTQGSRCSELVDVPHPLQTCSAVQSW
jgi:hypothetical protein